MVDLRTADGIDLQGHWYCCHPATAVVVLVHGFSGGSADAAISQLAAVLHASGFEVLTYDARGHGASGGRSAVGSMEHLDVACAAAQATRRGLPVVLLGISMGAIGVVRHLTTSEEALRGITGAVLVSGPARWRMRVSAVGLFTAALTRTPPGRWAAARWLGVRVQPGWRVGEPPESMMRRVRVPVAVIHGADDRLLAPAHGESLHHCAGGPSRLDLVAGMGHGLGDSSQSAAVSAVRWVLKTASVLGPEAVPPYPDVLPVGGLEPVTIKE